jgi:hypothetical protein
MESFGRRRIAPLGNVASRMYANSADAEDDGSGGTTELVDDERATVESDVVGVFVDVLVVVTFTAVLRGSAVLGLAMVLELALREAVDSFVPGFSFLVPADSGPVGTVETMRTNAPRKSRKILRRMHAASTRRSGF